jgi:hypothetical protein
VGLLHLNGIREKRPATQWVKSGLIGRVKHLRGEEMLRHASLQNFREVDSWECGFRKFIVSEVRRHRHFPWPSTRPMTSKTALMRATFCEKTV